MTCWVTVGDTLGNERALVDTLADTEPEMDEKSLGETQVGALALVDARADALAKVEEVRPGDTLGDAHALNDLLGDCWRHTGQSQGSGRQSGSHTTRNGGVLSI